MNRTMRGIDHIGLTVPDIDAAGRFLIDGLGARLLYEMLPKGSAPLGGPEVERAIALPKGALVTVIRMYQMEAGPGIELFEYRADEQREPVRASDFGWQHLAIYTDDLDAAVARAVSAGAAFLAEPWDMINCESGRGARFCFVKAPFGSLIEFITYPEPQLYERETDLRRWKPPLTSR